MAYSTTMRDFLTAIKNTLLLYQNTTLSKINTWQRGVLSPQTVWPSVAILPNNETFYYGLSNGKYEVEREATIEFYDIKMNTEQARDNTVDFVNAVKDIFVDNYTLSGSCYTVNWSDESYGVTVDTNRGFLQMSSITVRGRTRESFPELTVETSIVNNADTTTIQDKLLQILKNNKASYYSSVNTFDDTPIGVTMRYPAILVGAGVKYRNQNSPAADLGTINFDIAVITQLFHKETSLNYNLSIVEGVKDVLQINHQIDGYCEFSNIKSIRYEPSRAKNSFVYITTISYECRVREFR